MENQCPLLSLLPGSAGERGALQLSGERYDGASKLRGEDSFARSNVQHNLYLTNFFHETIKAEKAFEIISIVTLQN